LPPALDTRAYTKAGLPPLTARVSHLANCAFSDVPGACDAPAHDPAGAEVRAGLELPLGTDDEDHRRAIIRRAWRLLVYENAAVRDRTAGLLHAGRDASARS
jgi:hypothetical protein